MEADYVNVRVSKVTRKKIKEVAGRLDTNFAEAVERVFDTYLNADAKKQATTQDE